MRLILVEDFRHDLDVGFVLAVGLQVDHAVLADLVGARPFFKFAVVGHDEGLHELLDGIQPVALNVVVGIHKRYGTLRRSHAVFVVDVFDHRDLADDVRLHADDVHRGRKPKDAVGVDRSAGRAAGKTIDQFVREHVDVVLVFDLNHVDAEDGPVSGPCGVNNECLTWIQCVDAEGDLPVAVTGRLDVHHADTDRVEPVNDLIVRPALPADVQIVVQAVDLFDRGLVGLPGYAESWILKEIPVLKGHDFVVAVVYDLVVDLRADFLRAHEDRLKPATIPVQVLFLIHIDAVPSNRLVDDLKDVVFGKTVNGREDFAASAEHFRDDDRTGVGVFDGCRRHRRASPHTKFELQYKLVSLWNKN